MGTEQDAAQSSSRQFKCGSVVDYDHCASEPFYSLICKRRSLAVFYAERRFGKEAYFKG